MNKVIVSVNNMLNKRKKSYAIIPYSALFSSMLPYFLKYYVHSYYILKNWILIIFLNKNKKRKFIIKFFQDKNKENYYSFKKLKTIFFKKKYGIIFTSKGVTSLFNAIKMKIGGIMFCLIY